MPNRLAIRCRSLIVIALSFLETGIAATGDAGVTNWTEGVSYSSLIAATWSFASVRKGRL
jgi:hypothetical protein